ncbi:MAG: hypothetical protein IH946_04030 [Bacteroidetes bacterium]|nr:hypothetical protein [Bacteroidota bacterium]
MKKALVIGLFSLLALTNCKKELVACFNLGQSSIWVGENVSISDCSENAESYLYDFGYRNFSTSGNLEIKHL